jgi:Family of unknown function (DUF6358)
MMGKKIVLNILLNIAIFMLVLSLVWAFNHRYYTYVVAAILALALFIHFKVQLVKSVRKMTKKH